MIKKGYAYLKMTHVNSFAKRYINLSNYELGNYSKLLDDCKNQLMESTSDYEKYSIYSQMVVVYNKLGEFEISKSYLSKMKAINDSKKYVLTRDALEFLDLSMVTEKGSGNFKKAYLLSIDYISKLTIYQDSLNKAEIIKNEVLFETKEKELKVKELLRASQKDKAIIARERNQKKILLVISISAVFLIAISYLFHKNNRKKNNILKLQNKVIAIRKF